VTRKIGPLYFTLETDYIYNFLASAFGIWVCKRFIAYASASAGLPISSFSVNNITEKLRPVYPFNGLKIGSIHTLTACQKRTKTSQPEVS
jgi:hypothetical protein